MKQIILYGAGSIGKENYNFLKRYNLLDCVYCFCDQKSNVINNVGGIPVYPYEIIKNTKKEFIISVGSDCTGEVIDILSNDNQKFYNSLYAWLKKEYKQLLNHYRSAKGKHKKLLGIPIPFIFCNEIKCPENLWKKCSLLYKIKWKFLSGGDNIVSIGHNVHVKNVKIMIYGYANHIVIEDNCVINNSILRVDGKDNKIFIGRGTYIGGAYIHASHSSKIHIGRNCLFSHEIDIRSSDGHYIYGLDGNEVINMPKDIFIGDHVWIGKRVLCLKGTNILDDSIVGAGSVVTKKFDKTNIVIAGHPAKIIRTNVKWEQ